ncbi:MAG: Mpv17/PMP22 family protein, partial [Candidatus Omnitrophica bacterium]|nr:Mpv17/PMP22 family protein [Candidatus Omnitrophota bacterium]
YEKLDIQKTNYSAIERGQYPISIVKLLLIYDYIADEQNNKIQQWRQLNENFSKILDHASKNTLSIHRLNSYRREILEILRQDINAMLTVYKPSYLRHELNITRKMLEELSSGNFRDEMHDIYLAAEKIYQTQNQKLREALTRVPMLYAFLSSKRNNNTQRRTLRFHNSDDNTTTPLVVYDVEVYEDFHLGNVLEVHGMDFIHTTVEDEQAIKYLFDFAQKHELGMIFKNVKNWKAPNTILWLEHFLRLVNKKTVNLNFIWRQNNGCSDKKGVFQGGFLDLHNAFGSSLQINISEIAEHLIVDTRDIPYIYGVPLERRDVTKFHTSLEIKDQVQQGVNEAELGRIIRFGLDYYSQNDALTKQPKKSAVLLSFSFAQLVFVVKAYSFSLIQAVQRNVKWLGIVLMIMIFHMNVFAAEGGWHVGLDVLQEAFRHDSFMNIFELKHIEKILYRLFPLIGIAGIFGALYTVRREKNEMRNTGMDRYNFFGLFTPKADHDGAMNEQELSRLKRRWLLDYFKRAKGYVVLILSLLILANGLDFYFKVQTEVIYTVLKIAVSFQFLVSIEILTAKRNDPDRKTYIKAAIFGLVLIIFWWYFQNHNGSIGNVIEDMFGYAQRSDNQFLSINGFTRTNVTKSGLSGQSITMILNTMYFVTKYILDSLLLPLTLFVIIFQASGRHIQKAAIYQLIEYLSVLTALTKRDTWAVMKNYKNTFIFYQSFWLMVYGASIEKWRWYISTRRDADRLNRYFLKRIQNDFKRNQFTIKQTRLVEFHDSKVLRPTLIIGDIHGAVNALQLPLIHFNFLDDGGFLKMPPESHVDIHLSGDLPHRAGFSLAAVKMASQMLDRLNVRGGMRVTYSNGNHDLEIKLNDLNAIVFHILEKYIWMADDYLFNRKKLKDMIKKVLVDIANDRIVCAECKGGWLLTHAGVTQTFLQQHNLGEATIEEIKNTLNQMLKDAVNHVVNNSRSALEDFPICQLGGPFLTFEKDLAEDPARGIHQIFGHTPSSDKIRLVENPFDVHLVNVDVWHTTFNKSFEYALLHQDGVDVLRFEKKQSRAKLYSIVFSILNSVITILMLHHWIQRPSTVSDLRWAQPPPVWLQWVIVLILPLVHMLLSFSLFSISISHQYNFLSVAVSAALFITILSWVVGLLRSPKVRFYTIAWLEPFLRLLHPIYFISQVLSLFIKAVVAIKNVAGGLFKRKTKMASFKTMNMTQEYETIKDQRAVKTYLGFIQKHNERLSKELEKDIVDGKIQVYFKKYPKQSWHQIYQMQGIIKMLIRAFFVAAIFYLLTAVSARGGDVFVAAGVFMVYLFFAFSARVYNHMQEYFITYFYSDESIEETDEGIKVYLEERLSPQLNMLIFLYTMSLTYAHRQIALNGYKNTFARRELNDIRLPAQETFLDIRKAYIQDFGRREREQYRLIETPEFLSMVFEIKPLILFVQKLRQKYNPVNQMLKDIERIRTRVVNLIYYLVSLSFTDRYKFIVKMYLYTDTPSIMTDQGVKSAPSHLSFKARHYEDYGHPKVITRHPGRTIEGSKGAFKKKAWKHNVKILLKNIRKILSPVMLWAPLLVYFPELWEFTFEVTINFPPMNWLGLDQLLKAAIAWLDKIDIVFVDLKSFWGWLRPFFEFFAGYPFWILFILSSVLGTLASIAFQLTLHFLIQRLPERWMRRSGRLILYSPYIFMTIIIHALIVLSILYFPLESAPAQGPINDSLIINNVDLMPYLDELREYLLTWKTHTTNLFLDKSPREAIGTFYAFFGVTVAKGSIFFVGLLLGAMIMYVSLYINRLYALLRLVQRFVRFVFKRQRVMRISRGDTLSARETRQKAKKYIDKYQLPQLLELAFDELLMNAVEHGKGTVKLIYKITDNIFEAKISHKGTLSEETVRKATDPARVLEGRKGGRGLLLVEKIMNQIGGKFDVVNKRGRVHMTISYERPVQSETSIIEEKPNDGATRIHSLDILYFLSVFKHIIALSRSYGSGAILGSLKAAYDLPWRFDLIREIKPMRPFIPFIHSKPRVGDWWMRNRVWFISRLFHIIFIVGTPVYYLISVLVFYVIRGMIRGIHTSEQERFVDFIQYWLKYFERHGVFQTPGIFIETLVGLLFSLLSSLMVIGGWSDQELKHVMANIAVYNQQKGRQYTQEGDMLYVQAAGQLPKTYQVGRRLSRDRDQSGKVFKLLEPSGAPTGMVIKEYHNHQSVHFNAKGRWHKMMKRFLMNLFNLHNYEVSRMADYNNGVYEPSIIYIDQDTRGRRYVIKKEVLGGVYDFAWTGMERPEQLTKIDWLKDVIITFLKNGVTGDLGWRNAMFDDVQKQAFHVDRGALIQSHPLITLRGFTGDPQFSNEIKYLLLRQIHQQIVNIQPGPFEAQLWRARFWVWLEMRKLHQNILKARASSTQGDFHATTNLPSETKKTSMSLKSLFLEAMYLLSAWMLYKLHEQFIGVYAGFEMNRRGPPFISVQLIYILAAGTLLFMQNPPSVLLAWLIGTLRYYILLDIVKYIYAPHAENINLHFLISSIQTFFILPVGDMAAQYLVMLQDPSAFINFGQMKIMALLGFFYGLLWKFHWHSMESRFDSGRRVLKILLTDQKLFTPWFLVFHMTVSALLLKGGSPWSMTMSGRFIIPLVINWLYWYPVGLMNLKYFSDQNRILVVNIAGVFWAIVLSWIASGDLSVLVGAYLGIEIKMPPVLILVTVTTAFAGWVFLMLPRRKIPKTAKKIFKGAARHTQGTALSTLWKTYSQTFDYGQHVKIHEREGMEPAVLIFQESRSWQDTKRPPDAFLKGVKLYVVEAYWRGAVPVRCAFNNMVEAGFILSMAQIINFIQGRHNERVAVITYSASGFDLFNLYNQEALKGMRGFLFDSKKIRRIIDRARNNIVEPFVVVPPYDFQVKDHPQRVYLLFLLTLIGKNLPKWGVSILRTMIQLGWVKGLFEKHLGFQAYEKVLVYLSGRRGAESRGVYHMISKMKLIYANGSLQPTENRFAENFKGLLTIVAAENDQYIHVPTLKDFARRMRVRYVQIDGTDHLSILGNERFYEAVGSWYKEHIISPTDTSLRSIPNIQLLQKIFRILLSVSTGAVIGSLMYFGLTSENASIKVLMDLVNTTIFIAILFISLALIRLADFKKTMSGNGAVAAYIKDVMDNGDHYKNRITKKQNVITPYEKMIAVVNIVVLAPILWMISIIVWVDMTILSNVWKANCGRKGFWEKIIFTQNRATRDEKPFKIYKFQTIYPLTEKVTVTGHSMRSTHIDELPQLLNIAFGEMTIVGPRPKRTEEKGILKTRKWNHSSYMKSGLTGPAQLAGYLI